MKGTYTLTAGADPGRIRWRYDGVEDVTLAAETGALTLTLPNGGKLTEAAPVAWQTIGGRAVPVAVRYILHPDRTIGFAVGDYDRTQPLVLDPELVYQHLPGRERR